ncbi:hypothetical protein STIAU_1299, partial [Stigmatella aurantiaca DW4/3-1]
DIGWECFAVCRDELRHAREGSVVPSLANTLKPLFNAEETPWTRTVSRDCPRACVASRCRTRASHPRAMSRRGTTSCSRRRPAIPRPTPTTPGWWRPS